MQRRYRKAGDHAGLRKGQVKTSTCLKIVSLFFLVQLVSCGGPEKAQRTFDLSNPSKAVEQALSMVCLSGEGKGKISGGGKSHSFNFESRLTNEEWLLALSVPFLGEEVLRLNLIKGSPSGGLYNYLLKEVAKSKTPQKDQRAVHFAFKRTSLFLKGLNQIKSRPSICSTELKGGRIEGKCTNGIIFEMSENSLKLSEHRKFSSNATFSALSEDHFQLVSIDSLSGRGPKITLKYGECYSAQR